MKNSCPRCWDNPCSCGKTYPHYDTGADSRKHYTFHRVSVSSPTEGNMTEDEIKDILTCAMECPESPLNVERVEMLVDEALSLRSQLAAFTEGKPSRTDLERLSYFCHEFDYCVDASDWLKRIASMGDK